MGRHRSTRHDLPPRVYFHHRAYFFVRADGKWVNLGREYGKAMQAWAELVQPTIRVETINDLFDRYALQVLPKKAPRTQRDNLTEFRFLRSFFGEMPVELVKSTHIAEYRDTRTAKTRCNRELALLGHALRYAVEWGYIPTNPVREVTKNKERPRERYVTDDELEQFKKGCPEWLQIYVDVKLALGLRQRDLLNLTWDGSEQKTLSVMTGKTQTRLTFRVTQELETLLLQLPRRSGTLFATSSGQPYSSSGFASIWTRAMARFVSSGGKRFTEHDIRGKVATDMEDAAAAQRLLGHTSIKMTEAYIKQRATDVIEPHRRKK